MLSHVVVATGLTTLAFAPSPVILFAGRAIIRLGMGPVSMRRASPRWRVSTAGARAGGSPASTLIAGFASTVGWPLSELMLAAWGWREAGIGWALIHLLLARPLNACLPRGAMSYETASTPTEDGPPPSDMALSLPTFVFAAHVNPGAETVSIPEGFWSVWQRIEASAPHMADA